MMTARAALRCERRGATSHRYTRLRSQGQFVLRPTHPKAFEPWVKGDPTVGRVSLSSGAAGPLGGDHLLLDVEVGPGAVLVLNEISATLALPGTRGEQSRMIFNVTLDEGATLIWLPEPVIAANACDHRQDINVSLAQDARFMLREELILGRHNEAPGSIQQHLRVLRDGKPVFDQNLRLGPRYHGWDSPAVSSTYRAVGNVLVVDPGSTIGQNRSDLVGQRTVSLGIDPETVQISSVAEDSLELARSLDSALDLLGEPWAYDRSTLPHGSISSRRNL